jgi:hypothetical protein
MAVGGPENDVFAAADALLARGERPTVERVRSELGARQSGAGWWACFASIKITNRLRMEVIIQTIAATAMRLRRLGSALPKHSATGSMPTSIPLSGCCGSTAAFLARGSC